ncbi:MAG TPA: hypothetical protein VG842_11345 [Sediminibacterium sp.]|nr:hypothetical protein [Sediminibacterium sp.]
MPRFLPLLFFMAGSLFITEGVAQTSLPGFQVKELMRDKIQISWHNPFPHCIQLAVQRSADSSANFRTIFSAQSPELEQNGFVDSKPLPGAKSYYRIFYVLQGGAWFFTPAIPLVRVTEPVNPPPAASIPPSIPTTNPPGKNVEAISRHTEADKPGKYTDIFFRKRRLYRLSPEKYAFFKDSIFRQTTDRLHRLNENAVEWTPDEHKRTRNFIRIYQGDSLLAVYPAKAYRVFKDSLLKRTRDTLLGLSTNQAQLFPYIPPPDSYVYVYRHDSLVSQMHWKVFKHFRDSVLTRTKDTLQITDDSHAEIRPFVPRWQPSPYVFTDKRGYLTLHLPLVRMHHYRIVFFDSDGSVLFEVKNPHESELILDKTDFVHAGWFRFELYEDEVLKERNRFYLSRD